MEWNRVQFSFCQNEKTAYYMLLLSWQLQKDLASNAKDMSLATRRYFVWAIKSIREEMPISQTGTKIPESCAGMVAALGVAQVILDLPPPPFFFPTRQYVTDQHCVRRTGSELGRSRNATSKPCTPS